MKILSNLIFFIYSVENGSVPIINTPNEVENGHNFDSDDDLPLASSNNYDGNITFFFLRTY